MAKFARFAVSLTLTLTIIASDVVQAKLRRESKRETAESRTSLNFLVYETDVEEGASLAVRLVRQAEALPHVRATVFGQGQHFDGFGSKYEAVLPHLKNLPSNSLAVISDGRDVLINNPEGNSEGKDAIDSFLDAFHTISLAHPGAVIVSAEAQCCVSALTYAKPGDFFDSVSGERRARACSSGEANCLWNGDEKAAPWESFMVNTARAHVSSDVTPDDIYLNAGLMVGKVSDLLQVIKAIDLDASEDDQAVLTDFMYRNPDSLVLDYSQSMFGNNRGGLGEEDSCMFAIKQDGDSNRLIHKKTETAPLFVHSPGGYLECHDSLASALGIEQVSSKSRRLLEDWKDGCNYGQNNYACPENSERVPGLNCYSNFDDCSCNSGYVKAGDSCVHAMCGADKKPDGSGDCVSNTCYYDFTCPANSDRKTNRACYNNFDDCECHAGHYKEGEQCVQEYQCPANSTKRTNIIYCKKFEECICDNGYTPQNGECIAEPSCQDPTKIRDGSGDCVASWCQDNFICPSHSSRIANQDCYNDSYDCKCKYGYYMKWGRCHKHSWCWW